MEHIIPEQSLDLYIRPASLDDANAINRLIMMSFGPGRFAKTAERFREDPKRVLGPSLVATRGSLLVGVVLTHKLRDEFGHQGLFLGPLAVRPVEQQRGTGARLMQEIMGLPSHDWILLIGDLSFYGRIGFQKMPHTVKLPTPTNPDKILYYSANGIIPGHYFRHIAA